MTNINNFIEFIDDVNNISRRRPQVYKDRPNYYEILTDDESIYRFRLSKTCVNYLLNLLARKLETATDSGSLKIPVQDLAEIKMKMFKIARFPLVFGAIDCTHVRIQSPGGEFSKTFRNRKG
ncbi:hypothetical protein QTP88_015075 [Uroleucon formosanum]